VLGTYFGEAHAANAMRVVELAAEFYFNALTSFCGYA
jgi:hypothetical protein